VLTDNPPHPTLGWRLKTAAFRLVARRAIGILTNSTAEVETTASQFRIAPDRLRFVPLNTNIEAPEFVPQNDGYVFSAGRSLRDYETLLKAATHIPRKIVIVCGREDLRGVAIPQNVEVLRDLSRDDYLVRLRGAEVVALPLLPTQRATGQVVLLEAMAFGKPVVTTRMPGTTDYLRDGDSGVFVAPGDADGLATAVSRLLNDEALAKQIGATALAGVQTRFTIDRHAAAKLTAISELVEDYPARKH
jgi:glycosyltransferase involved in cell wall biosynthesis